VAKTLELFAEGRVGDAMRMLTRASLAPATIQTITALFGLHPDALDLVIPRLPDNTPQFELLRPVFEKVMSVLPTHRAPGPSGCRYEHLHTEWRFGDRDALFTALSIMAAGNLPPQARLLKSACRLVALLKAQPLAGPVPSSQLKVRPLGVGDNERRVCAIMMLSQKSNAVRDFFAMEEAANFAVGVPSGAECQVHLTRSALAADASKVTIATDKINAYNELSRQAMLDEVASEFPEFMPYVLQFYEHPAPLVFLLSEPLPPGAQLPPRVSELGPDHMAVILMSCQGVQQGDPLATFLYCLTEQKILKEAAVLFPTCDLSSFADDGYLTGPPIDALAAFLWLERELKLRAGLRFKPAASQAYSPNGLSLDVRTTYSAAGISVMSQDTPQGIEMLGSPLGDADWCRAWVASECVTRRAAIAKISILPNGDCKDGLLRHCASNWLLFLTRTTMPDAAAELADHGTTVMDVFFRSAGALAVGDYTKHQANLPLRWGGQGMEQALSVSPRAFLASWMACSEFLARLYPSFREANAELTHNQGNTLHDALHSVAAEVNSACTSAAGFMAHCNSLPANHRTKWDPPTGHSIEPMLKDAQDILTSFTTNPLASLTRVQSRSATAFHLREWASAIAAADDIQASILHGAATKGAMTWVEATPYRHLRLQRRDFIVAKQLSAGLPFQGMPACFECAICHVQLDGTRNAFLQHAASHGERTNHHCHAPVARQVHAMAIAQGHSAQLGKEGMSGDPAYPHSADVIIHHLYGPGQHCRVDVKTGAAWGVSALNQCGPRARREGSFTQRRETKTVLEHDPQRVIPFVATMGGELGAKAETLITEICSLSGGQIGGGVEPCWSTPNASKYWHRRIRVFLMAGTAALLREVAGLQGSDTSSSYVVSHVILELEEKRLTELVAAGRGARSGAAQPVVATGTGQRGPAHWP
jgi:hypothetical protein